MDYLQRDAERQREGSAEGKYAGRQPTARRKAEEVMRLCDEGQSANDMTKTLGISRASFFRIVADNAD